MSQGFRTIYNNKNEQILANHEHGGEKHGRTGKRMWHPTTSARGIMRPQSYPCICHSNGTTLVENIIIIIMHKKQMMNDNLKRCQMRGTTKTKTKTKTKKQKKDNDK